MKNSVLHAFLVLTLLILHRLGVKVDMKMNIQVINFEVCKDHYLMTKMIKKTKQNCIEYYPVHCYNGKRADYYVIISKQNEDELLEWCSLFDIPLTQVVILSNKDYLKITTWKVINLIDKEICFEKICQWLMLIIENTSNISIVQSRVIKGGSIKKDRELATCLKLINNQQSSIKENEAVLLFIKEKNRMILPPIEQNKHKIYQYFIKGISEQYDYLVIK